MSDSPLHEEHVCSDACAKLSLEEWLDTHRVISAGPNRGKLMRSDLTPFLMEILHFVLRPTKEDKERWGRFREGVIMKAARIGYTEGVIGSAICYVESLDPSPLAVLQPTVLEAQGYSRENIKPMLDYVPCLRGAGASAHQSDTGRRGSDNTLLYKRFPNGTQFWCLGSAAPNQLRRRTIRFAFADEIDGMKLDPKEGNPLTRYRKRTMDFHDGVMLSGSTPTIKGESIIDERWVSSDQRHWQCPCPHCGEKQKIEWKNIKWYKTTACKECGLVIEDLDKLDCECGGSSIDVSHNVDTAYLECIHCEKPIEEKDKAAMIRAGEWVPDNPFGRLPGWRIPAFLSLFPTATWAVLAGEWLDAQKSKDELQVFVNTVLAEVFEDRAKRPRVKGLRKRAERYLDASGEPVMVPHGVGILTAGVDVQQDWLELIIRGWGVEKESWDIVHQRINGIPQHQFVWEQLDSWLGRTFLHESGIRMRIMCTLIDSGHATGEVYTYTRPREGRYIFAAKGDTGARGAANVKRASVVPRRKGEESLAQRARVPLYTIGTFTQKDQLFETLMIEDHGPGYVHLRQPDSTLCNGFDDAYFKQFEAEAKHLVGEKHGRPEYRWVQLQRRNEAIDLHVLAMSAFDCLAIEDEMPQIVDMISSGKRVSNAPARRRRVLTHREHPVLTT